MLSANSHSQIITPPPTIIAMGRLAREQHVKQTALLLKKARIRVPSFDDFVPEPHCADDGGTYAKQQYKKRRPIRKEMSEADIQWLAERKRRGTHFPENPTPKDHIAFLHFDLMHDDMRALRRSFGLRRLDYVRAEDVTPENIRNGYAKEVSEPVLNGIARKINVAFGLEKVNLLSKETNAYATQSTFTWGSWDDKDRHRCSRAHLGTISTLFIDVDVYSSQSIFHLDNFEDLPTEGDKEIRIKRDKEGRIKRCSETGKVDVEVIKYGQDKKRERLKARAIDAVLTRLKENNIPQPVVIDSGRGVYLDWALGERISLRNARDFERWQAVQIKLIHLLYDLGADTKVKDLTRVLRLTGTTHKSAKKIVSVLVDDGKYHSLKKLTACTRHLSAPDGWIPRVPYPTAAQMRRFAKDLVAKSSKGKADRTSAQRSAANVSQGVALGSMPSQPLRALYRTQNAWKASNKDMAAFNAFVARLQTEFAKKNITSQQSLTLRYYRFLMDLMKMAQLRAGVQSGYRNNFVFWSIALLYNARLITLETLPAACAELQRICEGKENVLASGSLSTLLEKIELDEIRRQGRSQKAPEKETKMVKGFAVTSTPNAKPSKRQWVANHGGKDAFNGKGRHTYTPSVRFLIEHFGITPDEQEQMVTLTDEVEKQLRRSMDNKAHEIEARDRGIADAVSGGLRVDAAANQFGVSTATAYRAINRIKKLDAQIASDDNELLNVDENAVFMSMGRFYRTAAGQKRAGARNGSRVRVMRAREASVATSGGRVNEVNITRENPTQEVTTFAPESLDFTAHSHILSVSKKAHRTTQQANTCRTTHTHQEIQGFNQPTSKKSPNRHLISAPPAIRAWVERKRRAISPPMGSIMPPRAVLESMKRVQPLTPAVVTRPKASPVMSPPALVRSRFYRGGKNASSSKNALIAATPYVSSERAITPLSYRNILAVTPPRAVRASRLSLDERFESVLQEVADKREAFALLKLDRADALLSKERARDTKKALAMLNRVVHEVYDAINAGEPEAPLLSELNDLKGITLAIVSDELAFLNRTLHASNALNAMRYPIAKRLTVLFDAAKALYALRDRVDQPCAEATRLQREVDKQLADYAKRVNQNIISTDDVNALDALYTSARQVMRDEQFVLEINIHSPELRGKLININTNSQFTQ